MDKADSEQGQAAGFQGETMAKVMEIDDEDLRWLIEGTLGELYVQETEYSNHPSKQELERLERLIGKLDSAANNADYLKWAKSQRSTMEWLMKYAK